MKSIVCFYGYASIVILSCVLGAFGKLLKATVSFVLPVCLSVHPHEKNSAPTGRIFMKFDIWLFFDNLSIIMDTSHLR